MTVHYDFPCIQYWHTCAKYFEDNPNFVVVDKDGYFVVNYVRAGKDTHPPVDSHGTAILREARGLIFDSKTGELLRRPFHKFFNVGEREDVVPDLSRPHWVMDKLDGSMITPMLLNDAVVWCTKMGVTDVANQAAAFVAKHPEYLTFAMAALQAQRTPIFEWVSRQQQIVCDYPEDNLILLAIRDNWTGEYVPYDRVREIALLRGIPVVTVNKVESLDHFLANVRHMDGIEGFVVQFDDGHMVKIKTDWYVGLHRAKSLLDNERDVVGLILDERVDDLMPLLPDADKARLEQFQAAVWKDILAFITQANMLHQTCLILAYTRKDFALEIGHKIDPVLRSLVFSTWESKVCSATVVTDYVRKHLGSGNAFAKVRSILTSARWKAQVPIGEE